MEALWPNSIRFLCYNTLKPLFGYARTIPVLRDFYIKHNLSLEDLEAECRIFSRVLAGKEWPKDNKEGIDLVQVGYIICNEYGDSAPVVSSLYKVAITAGFTSTRVECLFSSLTRVDSPQRRSMQTERECELAYLAFESKILLDKVTFDDFLHTWKLSSRKLFDI